MADVMTVEPQKCEEIPVNPSNDGLSLSKEDVIKITSFADREDGRGELAYILNWEEFDEEDDFLRSILLDYLYDSLMFLYKKGLGWREICSVFQIVQEMQEEALEGTLTDAVKLFSQKVLKYGSTVTERNMKIFSQQFFDTFMSHYKLYQYCFTHEQDRMVSDNTLIIDPPGEIEPLKIAKTKKIWDYEQKLLEIDTAAEEHRSLKQSEQEKQTIEDVKQITQAQSTDIEEVTRENIIKIIKDVTTAYITATSHTIQSNMETSLDDMEYKLERTALPRPSELGAPPRYKLNTISKINQAPSSARKEAKSPKSRSGSRTQSRNNSLKVGKADRSKSPRSARSRKN